MPVDSAARTDGSQQLLLTSRCVRRRHRPARLRRLEDVPLYGVGVSAGAAFLLKMPRYLKVGSGGGGGGGQRPPCSALPGALPALHAIRSPESHPHVFVAWPAPAHSPQFDGLVAEALGVDPKSGAFDVLLDSEPTLLALPCLALGCLPALPAGFCMAAGQGRGEMGAVGCALLSRACAAQPGAPTPSNGPCTPRPPRLPPLRLLPAHRVCEHGEGRQAEGVHRAGQGNHREAGQPGGDRPGAALGWGRGWRWQCRWRWLWQCA